MNEHFSFINESLVCIPVFIVLITVFYFMIKRQEKKRKLLIAQKSTRIEAMNQNRLINYKASDYEPHAFGGCNSSASPVYFSQWKKFKGFQRNNLKSTFNKNK